MPKIRDFRGEIDGNAETWIRPESLREITVLGRTGALHLTWVFYV